MSTTEDNAVAAFNARFERVHTDEAKAERAAERAAYESRYEAMRARKIMTQTALDTDERKEDRCTP